MAREIVTRIWCDACLARDENNYTEATEMPPVQIGGAKPRVLALCDVDQKELFEPLRLALLELGQIVPGGAIAPRGAQSAPSVSPAQDGIACPLGCGSVLKNRDSLNGHTTKRHQQTLNEVLVNLGITELRDVNGVVVPAPRGSDSVPEVTEATCDQPGCGKVYSYPKYRRPAHALSIHLSQAHHIFKADREKAAAAARPAKKAAKKTAAKR